MTPEPIFKQRQGLAPKKFDYIQTFKYNIIAECTFNPVFHKYNKMLSLFGYHILVFCTIIKAYYFSKLNQYKYATVHTKSGIDLAQPTSHLTVNHFFLLRCLHLLNWISGACPMRLPY